ncbi:head GIN domain-containing protein [Hyphococcus luteus]|uniref:Putative auto-transporter adhesin head GIN domain-containing protein n=1 Tax=Hyphococcus luteus TaxID=2058213 RepID=A0A2S7KAE3_9PROT|nr:head GIN domain-containing protein [Marinicaulis flavus]PQA89472.1 hypothetical protein CW354_00945 [Marinicaulis flavus]
MKKLLVLAAGTCAAVAAGMAYADDDDTVSQELELSGFDRITIAGVYELDVRVGDDYSIRLSGPEYEMERVEASVKNGALVLDQRKGGWGERMRNNRDGVEAVITLPSLTGLEVSDVIDGEIAGVDAERFEIDISGVGDVSIDGQCGALDAHLSGVGELDAKGLECGKADIHVSGVGSAAVFASDEVDARVSGMGDIDVYGSPNAVHKNKSMFAEITVH